MCQLPYLPLDGSTRLNNHLISRLLRTGNTLIDSFLSQINYYICFPKVWIMDAIDVFQFQIAESNSYSSQQHPLSSIFLVVMIYSLPKLNMVPRRMHSSSSSYLQSSKWLENVPHLCCMPYLFFNFCDAIHLLSLMHKFQEFHQF